MKSTEENGSYERIVNILKNSPPDLTNPELIENEIIRRIRSQKQWRGRISDLFESLFDWVYIGWVRRSLIGISVVLVAIFVYQQAFIFRQVKDLNRKIVITGNESSSVSSSELEKRLVLYKMSSKLSLTGEVRISESQIEEFLDAYSELQVKYRNLLRIIEEDPELKEYIENKLREDRKYKPDI
ncbi:MAG: hypothetical protein RBS38_09750 [Bacteroidales bacterium]|jgi:hypothetical protein|nr:hypothetical protein [Bacteroidales bacterium]